MAQGTVFGAQWWPKWEGIQNGRDARIHVAGTCHCAQKLTQRCKKQPLLSSIYVMPDSLWPHKQGQKAHQAPLSFTVSQSLLRFMSIELVMLSNHLTFCSPFLLLPSVFLSIRVFSSELVLHIRWPKYWSFSISPSNEYSGLIFFRIDWFDLLAVQGTLKSLLQHHNSKASVLWPSAFFMVQLSHPYMTIAKTITLTVQTLVCKVMSLPFNTLSRLIIAFLPRSKHILILWLLSLSTLILEPRKI